MIFHDTKLSPLAKLINRRTVVCTFHERITQTAAENLEKNMDV